MLQTNYPDVNAEISKEDREYLSGLFQDYLNKLPEQLRLKIIPMNLIEVVMQVDSPIRNNGWHPALILHFNQFIESLSSK